MPRRLIREKEVLNLTGLSSSTLLRLEKSGKFPTRKKITVRTVAWSDEEVTEWVDSQIDQKLQGGRPNV